MSPEKQRRTFISYSRINKDFALKLAKELRASGFNIWFDQLDIPTGSRWDDEIEQALEDCEIFMVILTPASSKSDNVKDEIGYAIDTDKRILPILLENAKVPLRLRRFQYVDFTKKDYDEGIESAKRLLRKLIEEPTIPRDQLPAAAQAHKVVAERQAKKKAEADRKAKEEADRIAREKQEAERLAALKTEEERKAREAEKIVQSPDPISIPEKNSRAPLIIGAIGIGVVVLGVAVVAIVNTLRKEIPVTASTEENPLAAAQIGEDPSAGATAQQEATKVITPTTQPATPTPESPISSSALESSVFEESFDDNSNGWSTGSDITGSKSIEGGYYVWDVALDYDTDAWQFFNEDLSITDFDLRVDAKRVGGTPSDLCYGIVFRATQNDLSGIVSGGIGKYYELEVCDDQSYLITYYDGNDWNYWQDWTDNNGIRPNDWNTLEVKVSGTEFEYYINDTKVAEFSDSNIDSGNVGLSVYSYNETQGQILFDNFTLTPKSSASTTIFSDDFSSEQWGTGTDADSSVEYANNALQMTVDTTNWIVWSTPNDQDYENVHIEVTVLNNGTDPNTGFGIMCNMQSKDFNLYYLAVTPNGRYAIVKAVEGQDDIFITNDDQWASSDQIARNASSYHIGVDCGNGMLALYVDGNEIAEVSDSTYANGGVGLFTWSGEEATVTDVSFDDFVITELP